MEESRMFKIMWIMFFGIGLIFFTVGIIACFKIFDYNNKKEIEGEITQITSQRDSDNDVTHQVYVKYEVDGEEYESRLSSYSSTYHIGKKIKIYYDINHPDQIGTSTGDKIMLIIPFLGLIFTLIGGIALITPLLNKNKKQKLKENGIRIDANYVEVIELTNISVNGVHPFVIVCEGYNPGLEQKCTFRSNNIWFDPEDDIVRNNIKTFPVYINQNKPKKYFVDIDNLEGNEENDI